MDLTKPLNDLFSRHPNLGAVGFKLIGDEGQPTGSCRLLEPDAMGLLLGQRLESLFSSMFKPNRSKSMCIYSCAIAIRRKALEMVGGFDESFDFLDADIDFSIRLRKKGWNLQIAPHLVVFHKGGGSYQTVATRVLRHHKNRFHLLKKHNLLPLPWLFKLGLALRHFLEYMILRIAGKLITSDSVTLKDKLYGRRQLLRTVLREYE